MLLVIDNYDSFTYNLVQYLGELGATMEIYRNDKISLEECIALKPSRVLISPGPCTPKEAGISNDVIRYFSGRVPLLGVCLGHQCIGEVFGATVSRAKSIMHGKVSSIYHTNDELFASIPSPFDATRYHSLAILEETVPRILKVIARTDDDEIMGVKHRKHKTWGVQFHPESILTVHGKTLLKNFLEMC